MRLSRAFGTAPMEVLAAQRLSNAESDVAHARAAAAFGGGTILAGGRVRKADGMRRAAETFGLTGGELCGCHDSGCETCLANGGCGQSECATCAPSRAPGQSTAQGKAGRSRRSAPIPMFDMHSHVFTASEADWSGTRAVTNARIDALAEFKDHGVSQMVISALVDTDAPSPRVEGSEIDAVTAYAATRHPTFFVPFARGMELHCSGGSTFDVDSVPHAQAYLDGGFAGLGEFILHGHGGDFGTPTKREDPGDWTRFVEMCIEAARRYRPVCVHWEFGNVTSGDADYNWFQLLAFLETVRVRYPDVPPLKLIVAHAGAGPLTADSAILDRWKTRINFLLTNYNYVFFDIAGMQIPDRDHFELISEAGALTAYGTFLEDRISAYPRRFVVGIDTENREFISDWRNSIPEYQRFLELSGRLVGLDVQRALYDNGPYILGLRPSRWSGVDVGPMVDAEADWDDWPYHDEPEIADVVDPSVIDTSIGVETRPTATPFRRWPETPTWPGWPWQDHWRYEQLALENAMRRSWWDVAAIPWWAR